MEKTPEIDQLIRKHALFNAIKYGGKAKVEPVVSKILAERPDLKPYVEALFEWTSETVRKINELPLPEQKREMEERWPELLIEEKVVYKKVLPPLPNVKRYKRIVTRFSPNPDCVLHLGNARSLILSHDYARIYKGTFLLRFEDTDPKTKAPKLEFYDSIREDLLWLECKWDGEYRQSERLDIYYEYTKLLLERGNAYVCTCDREAFRKIISEKKPCPCRDLPSGEQLYRWEKMLDGTYGEGEALIRIRTDLSHPNPAVRDWPALRVIDTTIHPHPIVGDKYRVWPLYNLACGLDDHLLGITHIIRGKEHITNEIRQRFLYGHLGWMYPETVHCGRLGIVGVTLSKSRIKLSVEKGIYEGFSDPRLATLQALRRRGITSQAIREMMIEIGPKPVDVTISWENLYANNRKIVDPIADRYFFVGNPIKLNVNEVPTVFKAKIPLHPNRPERGKREFIVRPIGGKVSLLLAGEDLKLLKEIRKIRLMGLFNVEVREVSEREANAVFHSTSLQEARKEKMPIMQWLVEGEGIETEVIMPDASKVKGYAETACKDLREGSTIQFERFGFVRIDKAGEPLLAFFAHR